MHGVDAAAVGQAGVDHRAGLVDAAADPADDPLDQWRRCGSSSKPTGSRSQPPAPLDVDVVGPVDDHLGDARVAHQRLERPEAERVVEQASTSRSSSPGGSATSLRNSARVRAASAARGSEPVAPCSSTSLADAVAVARDQARPDRSRGQLPEQLLHGGAAPCRSRQHAFADDRDQRQPTARSIPRSDMSPPRGHRLTTSPHRPAPGTPLRSSHDAARAAQSTRPRPGWSPPARGRRSTATAGPSLAGGTPRSTRSAAPPPCSRERVPGERGRHQVAAAAADRAISRIPSGWVDTSDRSASAPSASSSPATSARPAGAQPSRLAASSKPWPCRPAVRDLRGPARGQVLAPCRPWRHRPRPRGPPAAGLPLGARRRRADGLHELAGIGWKAHQPRAPRPAPPGALPMSGAAVARSRARRRTAGSAARPARSRSVPPRRRRRSHRRRTQPGHRRGRFQHAAADQAGGRFDQRGDARRHGGVAAHDQAAALPAHPAPPDQPQSAGGLGRDQRRDVARTTRRVATVAPSAAREATTTASASPSAPAAGGPGRTR